MTVSAALMCHAPIVVPAIGGSRGAECVKTTNAMRQAAQALLQQSPHVLVVVSPHAPRVPDGFTAFGGALLQGTFEPFGRADLHYQVPGAMAALQSIKTTFPGEIYEVDADLRPLDHGTLVPLHFLLEAGWDGPTVVLGLPWAATDAQCDAMGQALSKAAREAGQHWALCMSGDMSHRLTPDAPSGYEPRAVEFDAWVVQHVQQGQLQRATEPQKDLRALAGEDVIDTLRIGSAAAGHPQNPPGLKLHNYEGPFGVGYLVATLYAGAV